jgi:hypothetical protein
MMNITSEKDVHETKRSYVNPGLCIELRTLLQDTGEVMDHDSHQAMRYTFSHDPGSFMCL